jgi:hypothetical protein
MAYFKSEVPHPDDRMAYFRFERLHPMPDMVDL